MSSHRLAQLDMYDAQCGMLTRDQLAELLSTVRVEDVAREAGLSTKTIYRLRHKKNAPTIETAADIIAAIKRLKRAKVAA